MLVKFKSLKDWGANKRKKFSKARKCGSLTMCKKCFTFYYKHSWHFYKPEQLEKDADAVISVHFTECPACLEQELLEDEPVHGISHNAEPSFLTELEQRYA
jgi:hypothetical protein